MKEPQRIRSLFDRLMRDTRKTFPERFSKDLHAPKEAGVYVIYTPSGKVDHVGESTSIWGRLRGHMHANSSYVNNHLDGDGRRLGEKGYKFIYLRVRKPRERMLLQGLAIGRLCPRYIGDRTQVLEEK
jgi:excinuclease UvrABC nuclease subunit